MKLSIIILLFILSGLSNQLKAQGEAAIPFLYLTPSPELNGLGLTGVSYPNDDPFGFYYNPANLGHFSQNQNLSLHVYPNSVDWLGESGLKFNNSAFNIGYNFKDELNGLNFSVGAGFIHSRFDFGSFRPQFQVQPYESYDLYNAYGLGASINYGIIFSAGITYKDIYSQLGSLQINSTDKGSTKANAIDYGFLITVPVIKLIDENYCFDFFNNSKIVPSFNYNLGYSRLNIGKEIYYVDPAQKDPLPLTARLGQTFNFGFNFQNNEISINLLNYDLILEADDILIDGRSNNEVSYQGFLGDIDFGKHLIQLKGDNKVVVHKGHAISFVETVTLLKGSFHGRGYMDIRQTDGLMLSTNGLFKWVSSQINNGPLKFITDHLELRYISSSIFNNSDIETNFSGLSVSFVNYSFN